MNQHPLVSIITPSLNQAAFISHTLESVAQQDYTPVEHIIIDGGSVDGSLEVIQAHAGRYPDQVRWISEPDQGQADAINKGFHMAQGKIIAWLNSDDAYLYRSTLREVVEEFIRLPKIDVLYGDVILIDGQNRVLRAIHLPPYQRSRILRHCRLFQPASFLRQRVIELEELDISLNIVLDYEYWLRLGRENFNFRHLPRFWAVDRNHPARKILDQREQLQRERAAIQHRFGLQTNISHYVNNGVDKLIDSIPARLKGLWSLRKLYQTSPSKFALPLTFDPLLVTLWRQIYVRNRDL